MTQPAGHEAVTASLTSSGFDHPMAGFELGLAGHRGGNARPWPSHCAAWHGGAR